MSVKHYLSGLLASVCLLGILAGGAVFAQDAAVDEGVVDQPAVDTPTDPVDDIPAAPDVVVDPEPVIAALDLPPEIVPPAMAAAAPPPDEQTGFEVLGDNDLTEFAGLVVAEIVRLNKIVDNIGSCNPNTSVCSNAVVVKRGLAQYQEMLVNVNEELRRRATSVVAVQDRVAASETAPPRDYCAELRAKGNFSDCRWSYKQRQ